MTTSNWNASVHPRGYGGKFIASGSTGQAATGASKRLRSKLTTDAIKAFQKSHGLVIDGLIGRQTADALLGNTKARNVLVGALTAKQIKALEAIAQGKLPNYIPAERKKQTRKPRAASATASTAKKRPRARPFG